jgi:integrase
LSHRRSLEVAPVGVVHEILGHTNIRQTMDTYSHVLPNMQQQAAERMDQMLG